MLEQDEVERAVEELREVLGGAPLPIGRLLEHARAVATGVLGPASNRLTATPRLPAEDELDEVDAFPPARRDRLERAGRAAIRAGHVAVCVLNGGMATRFGGRVKGVVEAFADRSFLEIKRAQAARFGPVPFLVMTSFATDRATRAHLVERDLEENTLPFVQSASLRLTPDGALFRSPAGTPSPYAPGHGDFADALRDSGTLERLEAGGVRAIALSNVDNLGAELDPLVVGYHFETGRSLTAEVVRVLASDAARGLVGGAPLYVDGTLELVEAFRLPETLDLARLQIVNTNSSVISLDALEAPSPLRWYYVEKRVDDRVAIQVEHLIGELTAFVPSAFLVVPRTGPRARYFPVKTPRDLEALRVDPELVSRFTGA